MMRYSVILFDLDGTILNTLDDLAASTNRALAKNGLPTRSTEEVRRFVGNGIRLLIERAVPENTPLTLTDRVFDDFRTDYAEHCVDHTLPYDGIPELLRALRASGARTAVISNKADSAVQELIAHYFPGLFDAVVGERPGVRRKPAPDAVLEVLRTLSAAPAGAVYIGDSEVDVESARNAGLPCIAVDWGFRSREILLQHGAQTIASSPAELQFLLA